MNWNIFLHFIGCNHTINSGKYSIDTVDINIKQDLTQEEILAAADKIRADIKQKEKEKYELYLKLKKEYEDR